MVFLDPAIVASTEALFRYTVVSQVRSLELAGRVSTEAVREVSQRLHYQLNGVARRLSERTVYRWLAAYEEHGVSGLEPTPRPRTDSSVVLPVDLLSFVIDQRGADPDASIPELIKRARELGKIPPETRVVRQTLYRALRRMGVSTGRRKKQRDRDSRQFAYPHRLDMVLADGKHFRAGARRLRRVALFFLDDATRYGLHVVVGTAESAVLFLRGLYELIRKYGIGDIYYMDQGPGFIAEDTVAVLGRIDRPLIHGRRRTPRDAGRWRGSTGPPRRLCCATWTAVRMWIRTAGLWSSGSSTTWARSTTTSPTRAWMGPLRSSGSTATPSRCVSRKTTRACGACSW